MTRTLLFTTAKILIGRESWRFFPAWIAYLHSKNRYDLKLLTDSTFRQMAEIDDWLTDDPPSSRDASC
jgi:hypothetical protein